MSGSALLAGGGEPEAAVALAPVGTWAAAGTLPTGMRWYGQNESPQLLADGRVLAVGGTSILFTSMSDTALYDPATGTWSAGAPLGTARRMHTLTVLADGRVLATGGTTGGQSFPALGMASTELYDPATGTWTATGALTEPRCGHAASLLPDGRVLVSGGEHARTSRSSLSLTTAELYDPATGTWTATGAMNDARWHHQSVVLDDGRVLAIGGLVSNGYATTAGLALCELYDPATGTWSAADTMAAPRFAHQAVRLLDGTVLVTGGGAPRLSDDAKYDPYSFATTERYDPVTGQWRPDTSLPWGRSYHRAVLLPSGDCLVVAGTDDASLDAGFRNAVRYDPATRTWTPTGGMLAGRWGLGVTVLADGRVLAVGGISRSGVACPVIGRDEFVQSAEVYTP